ncbi:MAG TPA: VTT domain-containing protein [Oleiagrimonas sp.]|nr:VTT domain-containing protein [Oleiagrimonas sp.]
MKRLRAALPLILLVGIGIALFASGGLDNLSPAQLASQHGQLHEMIYRYPWISRVAYVGFLTIVVATGVPISSVVTVAAGLLLDSIAEASALSTVGVVLGSLLLFAVTRLALGEPARRAPALAERLRHGYAHHPLNYTLFLRLAPGLPWGGVTVALAWLRCPMKLFLGATTVGAVATTIIESTVGAGIREGLARGQQHFSLWAMLFNPYILASLGGLALLALVPLLFGHLHRPPHTSDRPPH